MACLPAPFRFGLALTAAVLPAGLAAGQSDVVVDRDPYADTDYTDTTRRGGSAYSDVDARDRNIYGPSEGSWEFILGGSGSSDQDFDSNAVAVDATVGYYFTDIFEAGLRQNVTVAGNEDDQSFNGSSTVFADLVFDAGKLRPFVGVSLGYLYGDDTENTFIAGPEAGLKYYVKSDAFVYGRVNYDFLFDSGDEIDDRFDDGRFVYTIGIGLNF